MLDDAGSRRDNIVYKLAQKQLYLLRSPHMLSFHEFVHITYVNVRKLVFL